MDKKKKITLFICGILLFAGIVLILRGCQGKSLAASSENLSAEDGEEGRINSLTRGNVTLSQWELISYGEITDCSIKEDGKTVGLTLTLPDIPGSDDALVYLFEFEVYEDTDAFGDFERKPIASMEKAVNCEFQWTYKEEQLFRQFVPALLVHGEYIPVSSSSYINNPEVIARNTDDYPESRSKKGLLLDPELLGTPKLEELGVQHAIYNIPLSIILGETTDDTYPTIFYDYRGKTYQFNGAAIAGYDNLFYYLTAKGMLTTAIILNDWNEEHPELIHPLSRNKKSGAYYYAFNCAEEEGCLYLEAIACFLAERYSGGEYGLVSSWVIANEINQHKLWNFMDTSDITMYAVEFEKALRVFYNAAKRNFAGAKVYLSIDHDWNDNEGKNDKFFNARDMLEAVNKAARQKGNYDWGVAIHPYPAPLTRVNYWNQTYDKTMDAPVLTPMNLSTVTDFLKQEEYLDRSGNVRSISVTELGFTSNSGEKLQAAAFAYCYYIIDANPYIEAFIMNRQTDAMEEVKQGLSFGIYKIDHTPKFIYKIFKEIDTEQGMDNVDFMLNIIGAESLEEALLRAQ